ncbi:MAG: hypothetical protein ACREF8_00350 [Chthoniobacterales bacterium]
MISRAAPEFWELYHELSPEHRSAARRAYQLFSENPAHPGLRLERLRFDPRAWSVRVSRDIRTVALRHKDEWLWIWVGTHKDFERRFPR